MKRRSNLNLVGRLLALVKPLLAAELAAILMGVAGFVCATFLTIFGAYGVLGLLGFSVPMTQKTIYTWLIVFAVCRGFLGYAEQYCNHYIAFHLLALLRDKMFTALRRLCPAKLEGKDKGDLISIITSDIEAVELFYAHTISPVSIAFIMSVIMVIFIGSFHIVAGVIAAIAYLTVGVLLPLFITKMGGDKGMDFRRRMGALNGFVLDSLRGLKEILQYGKGKERLESINARTDDLAGREEILKKENAFNSVLSGTLVWVFSAIMLFVCAGLYRAGRVDFTGVLVPFVAMLGSFGPVLALASLGSGLQQAFAAANRILDILDEEPQVPEKETGEALSALCDIADVFLLHNRQIDNRCDDSLVYPLNGKEYFVRRSRGYVPQPVFVPDFKTPVLACGAQQKASFCLAANGRAYLSAHIGDLESIETFEHYASQVRHFERLFEIAPAAVACDLHPDYLSTRFAEECAKQTGAPLFRVQHHHAHMAACMADNELSGDVIGVVFDGTGLGEDGTIWGGEFLFGSYQSVRRMGHLAPFPLSGGDAAARDPVRAAFGALYAAGVDPCEIFPERRELPPPLAANVNCPATTSAGRLFDAMAALCGITEKNAYEARSAMLLQSLAQRAGEFPADAPWDVRLIGTADGFLLDTLAFLTYAAHDKRAGRDPRFTAEAFHRALAAGVLAACRRIRSATQCSRVVLSGGVFLNLHLLSLVQKALEADGFAVFCHRRVSCCDEGLSLGQAAVAQALLSAR